MLRGEQGPAGPARTSQLTQQGKAQAEGKGSDLRGPGGPWGSQLWARGGWVSLVWKGCCGWHPASAAVLPELGPSRAPPHPALWPLPHLGLWAQSLTPLSE